MAKDRMMVLALKFRAREHPVSLRASSSLSADLAFTLLSRCRVFQKRVIRLSNELVVIRVKRSFNSVEVVFTYCKTLFSVNLQNQW